MIKVYKIRNGRILWEKWMVLAAKSNGVVKPMAILQNEIELTPEEMNDWYKKTNKEIDDAEKHFKNLITEMRLTLAETVTHIKNTI